MARPDALPDASVPEAAFLLPDLPLAGAILLAPRGSDASAAVPPDEAWDAALPVPADARYAEKLAAQVQAVPALDAKLRQSKPLPAAAAEPCTRAAGPSAA
jgi:hypothetical protein